MPAKDASKDKNMPTTYVAYLRVSTESQGKSGLGLSAQKSKVREYVKAKGGRIQKYYTDIASGTKTPGKDRPALEEMLRDLNAGTIIIVAKRDRLARDMFLNLWIERQVKKIHAVIESASGEGNGSDPSSELMKNILNAFGAYERDLISQRTSDALQRLKERRKLGRPPYGYRINANGKQVKDPKTFPHRQRIEELVKDGLGWNKISRILNDENRPTQRGGRWHASTVWNMINKVIPA